MWYLIFFLLISLFCLIVLYIDLFFKFRDLENNSKTNEEYFLKEIHILKCNQTAILDSIVKLVRK